MEHEHKKQGDVIDGKWIHGTRWCKSMENEYKTQCDINRWNTNTRNKVM